MPEIARPVGNSGIVTNFGGVRLRVTGMGTLRMQLSNLDETEIDQIPSIQMSERPGMLPFRLANLNADRASLRISTNSINEHFRINQIILFHKPIWAEWPGE